MFGQRVLDRRIDEVGYLRCAEDQPFPGRFGATCGVGCSGAVGGVSGRSRPSSISRAAQYPADLSSAAAASLSRANVDGANSRAKGIVLVDVFGMVSWCTMLSCAVIECLHHKTRLVVKPHRAVLVGP